MNPLKEATIKQLTIADITPGLLADFAHCQRITKKWAKKNDVWVLTDASLLREWSKARLDYGVYVPTNRSWRHYSWSLLQ